MPKKASGRKPRAPRAPRAPRKAAQQSRNAQESRRLMKRRIIALESRMTVLERLLESINTPEAQAYADACMSEAHRLAAEVRASAEEE